MEWMNVVMICKKKMHIIEYAVFEKWPVSSWIEHATGFVVWHHAIHFRTYLENNHSIINANWWLFSTHMPIWLFLNGCRIVWRICLLASSNNYISRDFFLFTFNSRWIVCNILFIVWAHSVFYQMLRIVEKTRIAKTP